MSAVSIEPLKAKLAGITAWQKANIDKAGTPEFRNATAVHRLLTDLVARGGGSPNERAYVARKLDEIAAR